MGAESAKPSQSERSGRQRARRHVQRFAVVGALFAVSALASHAAMASSPRTFHTTFQESEQFLDEGATQACGFPVTLAIDARVVQDFLSMQAATSCTPSFLPSVRPRRARTGSP